MPPGTLRRSCSTAISTDGTASTTPVPRRVPVQLLEPGAARFPREAGRPRRPGRHEVPAGRVVDEAARQGGCESLCVTGVDQERAVPDDLGHRAGPGGHDGYAGTHGLQRGKAETLVERRVGEHGSPAVERSQVA